MNAERLKYVTAVVLYGTIGVCLRYVSLPSEIAALCRGVIGSLFLLAFSALRKQMPQRGAIRSNWFWLILSGVCLGLNWIFLFAAYTHTTVAIASLCNYMAPLIVILVAPLLLREPMEKKKLPCVAAALVGILLVSGVFGGEKGEPVGVAFGLAAAAGFVCIVLCNRKLRGITATDRAIVQLAVSAVTILPYAIVKNRGAALTVDARSVLVILLLGVVHTGVAYRLYFSGMAKLPVQTVAVLGYLEPVVSVLCSALLLHEPMSAAGWVGAVLIIAAAVTSELIPSERKEAALP